MTFGPWIINEGLVDEKRLERAKIDLSEGAVNSLRRIDIFPVPPS